MDKKEIIAIVLAALLVLLVLASAHAFGETTEAGNARLIFDDPSLESGTYAAMNFYDMENITSANISVELNDLQEGNIWAFYQTQQGNDTNDTQTVMLELYYINGMLEVYKYTTRSYYSKTTESNFYSTTVYEQMVNQSNKKTFLVGYVHDGQILNISYKLANFGGNVNVAPSDNTATAIVIDISIGNYSFIYNSENDNSVELRNGWATNRTSTQVTNYSRGMMFGSFDDRNLGKSEFSIDNMEYKAYLFSNITHNISENWTSYYNHFFHSGESLTDNSGAYAVFAISSPARIYVLDAPLSAPASIIYVSPNVVVSIQSWFLSNAWWIISILLVIILADLILDAKDLKEDRRK